jgi:hypothetical protein
MALSLIIPDEIGMVQVQVSPLALEGCHLVRHRLEDGHREEFGPNSWISRHPAVTSVADA